MIDPKEVYMRLQDEMMSDLIDLGFSEEEAYQISSDRAYDSLPDRIGDLVDQEYQKYKDILA